MVARKTTSKRDNLGAKRDEIMKLRDEVSAARDERLAAETASQEKIQDAQLDDEIARLKTLLAQETGFLEDTTSDTVDNKNSEV